MSNAFTMVRPKGSSTAQSPKAKLPKQGRPPPPLRGSEPRDIKTQIKKQISSR